MLRNEPIQEQVQSIERKIKNVTNLIKMEIESGVQFSEEINYCLK